MLIRAGYEIQYECPLPTAMLLLLSTHPSRAASLREPETLVVTPSVPVETFTDGFGNCCGRIVTPAGLVSLCGEVLVEDDGLADPMHWEARQYPVAELPFDVLPFLLGSRYCPVQELGAFAWEQFGGVPLGWGRGQAVCDWVHANVRFDYMTARPTKTAGDVWQEREGGSRTWRSRSAAV